ncbi:phosphate acetyltransferase [Halospina denitrificans]|uniref:Phosphate acetyltransferase n=1 Tax=Halospina denitrificans TaxID=332522 RepID=A0A4R7JU90_9GAMM|nr:phosphate acetyltransferase [Halospina denitrificans]TDT41625.1 phosphate acetyltransferase [Halospina denitrificans]
MPKNLFVVSTELESGLTSVSMGLVRALDGVGVRVGFYKPIAQTSNRDRMDHSVNYIRARTTLDPSDPIPLKQAQERVNQGESGQLMEDIIEGHHNASKGCDVVVVEGLVPDRQESYVQRLNVEIARNLDAQIILVSAPGERTPKEMAEHLAFSARIFSESSQPEVLGVILNRLNEPANRSLPLSAANPPPVRGFDWENECDVFRDGRLQLIGAIPWRQELIAPRVRDVAHELDANMIFKGSLDTRRVHQLSIVARTIPNMVDSLRPGTLVVTPGDREDIVMAAALAALSGVPLAGLVLTGGLIPDKRTQNFCKAALDTGVTVLTTTMDTYSATHCLANMDTSVPIEDTERVEKVMQATAEGIDAEWLRQHLSVDREPRLSPPAFRYLLTQRAREADKRIVLPEGDEPRTLAAAARCQERGLARCVLIGSPKEIHAVAESKGIKLPEGIEIIDPDEVRDSYIDAMVELRKHKGMKPDMAEALLEDNVMLATLMVALDEMDGLVSGAVHTTANTIRPALQLIKTHEQARIVSSVFFMCLPDQVRVYGDCAVNPDPDAEELADIAIQSADSASTFGITPKVAMVSYSTGDSGTGDDVEKVRKATAIAQKRRPDLIIDGPLQYDAAATESVAKSKAPKSPVAGKATVFVFPDLNTGNTTYKAVQRSANVVSIGPMLQGLRKPVNDLSRGALVDDIVFTIALTAIQARQVETQGLN